MKKMKLMFTSLLLALAVVMSVPSPAFALSPGSFLGNVLNTDIRVYIDNVQIKGYNIDGNTYIVAEDLSAYGFTVIWNDAARSLSVTRGASTTLPGPVPANLAPVGSVAFPYVSTDIVTYIDGRQVPSYNIQGYTVIRIEDVAAAFGYIAWDPVGRLLHVTTAAAPAPLPAPAPAPAPAPTPAPIAASITSVDYNRITVESGQSVVVTVVTNAATNYVWVELGGGNYVDAVFQSQNYYNDRIWTATFYPTSTLDAKVHANTTRDTRGAAVKSQRVTVRAAEATIANLTANRTSVRDGESVTFTVRTSAAVNNVWVEYSGTSANASYRYTDGSYQVWEATIYPRQSERVTIYANTSRTYTGAASKTQQITVDKQRLEVYGVTASRNNITPGDYTTIRIETSQGVEQVYVEFDGRTATAAYYTTSGNRLIWNVDIRPNSSQMVYAVAYARNNQYDAARGSVYITVVTPAPIPTPPPMPGPVPPAPPVPPAIPVIHRATADRTTIEYGYTTFITIETSVGVEQVFVEYDDVRIQANFISMSGYRANYRAYVSPSESQYILVTATDAYGADAYQNVYITVNVYTIMPIPGN